MDKSFDGMHEKYDFDSIRFSVKKTISISISMIVTSVFTLSANDYMSHLQDATTVELVIKQWQYLLYHLVDWTLLE